MIWKLLHRMFGWDYVAWENSADQGVARVYTDGRGVAYYARYQNIGVYDEIVEAEEVIWLTCEPSKYMKRGSVDRGTHE